MGISGIHIVMGKERNKMLIKRFYIVISWIIAWPTLLYVKYELHNDDDDDLSNVAYIGAFALQFIWSLFSLIFLIYGFSSLFVK